MLAQFQLIERLGQGAFGEVWKARDTQLDRMVAVKLPRREKLSESESEQFLREARAAAQVRHRNIVAVHEAGRADGRIYIASDYIEGASLDEWIQAQPLTVRESVELCAVIAEALHQAHEAGIVHRDLKPQNILMDLSGEPHVVDFGLAKRDAGEITMTIEGAILGTPAYMPPEQARGDGHNADRRSDVYSLGVILYRLLTGELPFRGQRQMLVVQILNEEPAALRKLDARIPRDVETICLKCLEKEPSRRYQSAAALASDLRRWLTGHPIEARPVSQLERAWRWCHRNPSKAILALSLACTAFTAIALVTNFWLIAESARQESEITLVDGWVRTIGTSRGALEKNAHSSLWDIAKSRDDLRLLFMKRALSAEEEARSLIPRREFVAQAVVGIEPSRRRKLLQLLTARLQAPDAEPGAKVASALMAVTLEDRNEHLSRSVIPLLLREMDSPDRTIDLNELIDVSCALADSLPNLDFLTADVIAAIDHLRSSRELLQRLPFIEVVVRRSSQNQQESIRTAVTSAFRRLLEPPTSADSLVETARAVMEGNNRLGLSISDDLSDIVLDEIQRALSVDADEAAISVYSSFVASLSERFDAEKPRQVAGRICDEILIKLTNRFSRPETQVINELVVLIPLLDSARCEAIFKEILTGLHDRRFSFHGAHEVDAFRAVMSRFVESVSSADARLIADDLLRRLVDSSFAAPERDLEAVTLIAIASRLSDEDATQLAQTVHEVARQAARSGTYELPRLAEAAVAFHRGENEANSQLLSDTARQAAKAFDEFHPSDEYHPTSILEMYLKLAQDLDGDERRQTIDRLGKTLLRRLETAQSPQGLNYASECLDVLKSYLPAELQIRISTEIIDQIRRIADAMDVSQDHVLQSIADAFTKLDRHEEIVLQKQTAKQLAELIVRQLEASDFRSEPSRYTYIHFTDSLGQILDHLNPDLASELGGRAVRRILLLARHETYWDVVHSLGDVVRRINVRGKKSLAAPILDAIEESPPQRRKKLLESLHQVADSFDANDAVDTAKKIIDFSATAGSAPPLEAIDPLKFRPGTLSVTVYAPRFLATVDDSAELVKLLIESLETAHLVELMKRPAAVGKIQGVLRTELLRRVAPDRNVDDFWQWTESQSSLEGKLDLKSNPIQGSTSNVETDSKPTRADGAME